MEPRTTREWLEADGLGGFASGTEAGIRTRRYHALLLTATTPPTGRMVLVNGVEAWVETPAGTTAALSSHSYAPGVVHPDGCGRMASFTAEPWPTWRFDLPDGGVVEHEVIALHGTPRVLLSWRLLGTSAPYTLHVRPLMSGRDYHALQRENDAFRFEPKAQGQALVWQPYDGVPSVHVVHSGVYEHAPEWYRSFLYDAEAERGLDSIEDLASPGVLRFELGGKAREATMLLASGEAAALTDAGAPADPVDAVQLGLRLKAREARRRARFPTPRDRAVDAYIVARGTGRTIVAGYPWFTDWGRDTFIALRGLCLATGRLDDARAILVEWASTVSHGMLPNRFPDGGEPEFNSVDASLWYVVAVYDYLAAAERVGRKPSSRDRGLLVEATDAIVAGYTWGTRFGIRADDDGLLACGEPGTQLTWMDAKVGDWVVTPRIGKPVEVQALWLNALRLTATSAARRELLARGLRSFDARFWNERDGYLHDVVDVDHVRGTEDGTLRPNQVLALGGLPLRLVDGERARRALDTIEQQLWTPLGLRTLPPADAAYAPHYQGGPAERDAVYHQGTAWPWLAGPFVDAWVASRGGTSDAYLEARARFVSPLMRHLSEAGLGHVSEIADGNDPHTPRGCPFQAWSLGELLRLDRLSLVDASASAEITSNQASRSTSKAVGGRPYDRIRGPQRHTAPHPR